MAVELNFTTMFLERNAKPELWGRAWPSCSPRISKVRQPDMTSRTKYMFNETFMLFRVVAVPPIGHSLAVYMADRADARDSGPPILGHLYLLLGCAAPLW
jgi:hypothetical protein